MVKNTNLNQIITSNKIKEKPLMKKPWIHQRKGKNGWFVDWIANGQRHQKSFPNEKLAETFADRKKFQLNSDIYFDPIKVVWEEAKKEYLSHKEEIRGLTTGSIISIKSTLNQFRRTCGPVRSDQINQSYIDRFIKSRRKKAKNATVNKDLRNLRAFVNWLKENHYSTAIVKWHTLKEDIHDVTILDEKQLANLTAACMAVTLQNNFKKPTNQQWYIRVLLAISTGLRQGDIERLKVSDIDFKSGTMKTFSKKTRKHMDRRPIHSLALCALKDYCNTLPPEQDQLFTDKFNNEKWTRIRNAAGLPGLRFHALRGVFASFIALAGFSTSTIQRLLEHSTPGLTHKVYINVDRTLKDAVESVPIQAAIIAPAPPDKTPD